MDQTNAKTPFEMVGEFHTFFGHPLEKKPVHDIFTKNEKLVDFRLSLIKEELKECEDGCKKNDLVEVADALCDIMYVVLGAGHAFGLDLDKLFVEVHESNMSKLCKSENEAKETVEWYKKNETRYKNPSYRKSEHGELWVVYDADTSKILKSINFKNPELKKIMDEQ